MSGLLLLAFAAVKRIAIIGGGLAGLGTAVSLLDSGACVVHVYDAEPTPGTGGASAVAAGLLHPFRPNGREIWLGRNGFEATSALVERCEKLIGARLSGREGLLRLALDADQAGDLQAAVSASAESHGPLDQTWWTREQVQAAHAGTAALGGAFAPSAMSLDTPAYLKALWKLCEAIGAETQLLYASDWPHWDFDVPSAIWDLPFLSDQGRRNILGLNAARLFGLEVPARYRSASKEVAAE